MLVANKGCFLCTKKCKFNGLSVSPDSSNAIKDTDFINKADRYGCNSKKE